MRRVPQPVVAWVVPDVAEVDVWAELKEAASAGLPVVLSVEQAKRLIAEHNELLDKLYSFKWGN